MLELELLGPMRLRRAGTPLPLTVRKSQALLVLLAGGGAAKRSRIVALLWPKLDEPSDRRNRRRELARLREADAAEAALAEGDVLRLGPAVASDLASFMPALAEWPAWREGFRARFLGPSASP